MKNINIINWEKTVDLLERKYYYRSYAVLNENRIFEAEITVRDNGTYGCNCFDNGYRFACFEESDLDDAMMKCDSYILNDLFN